MSYPASEQREQREQREQTGTGTTGITWLRWRGRSKRKLYPSRLNTGSTPGAWVLDQAEQRAISQLESSKGCCIVYLNWWNRQESRWETWIWRDKTQRESHLWELRWSESRSCEMDGIGESRDWEHDYWETLRNWWNQRESRCGAWMRAEAIEILLLPKDDKHASERVKTWNVYSSVQGIQVICQDIWPRPRTWPCRHAAGPSRPLLPRRLSWLKLEY